MSCDLPSATRTEMSPTCINYSHAFYRSKATSLPFHLGMGYHRCKSHSPVLTGSAETELFPIGSRDMVRYISTYGYIARNAIVFHPQSPSVRSKVYTNEYPCPWISPSWSDYRPWLRANCRCLGTMVSMCKRSVTPLTFSTVGAKDGLVEQPVFQDIPASTLIHVGGFNYR